MFYFILGFFAFLFLFSFLTRRFRNPWKLYMIFGKKGSGKSTFLVRQAVSALRKGKDVYTNMSDLNIVGVRYIDPLQLGEFVPSNDSVLLLDEVGMIWDNRHFKSFDSRTRDFFKLQRHYHVTCFLASQTWDVDKKIRDLFDAAYLCVNLFGVLAVYKRITRRIVLTESTSEAESRIAENLKFAPIFCWKFCWIPKFAKFYNSFVAPQLPIISYVRNTGGLSALRKKDAKRQLEQLAQISASCSSDTAGGELHDRGSHAVFSEVDSQDAQNDGSLWHF